MTQKAVEAAKKSISDAKADYLKKKEAEMQARTKAAQNGTYLPKESERGIFHVKLDKPAFDPKSGKKLSKEYIQKFTVAEWNSFVKNSSGLGYDGNHVEPRTIQTLTINYSHNLKGKKLWHLHQKLSKRMNRLPH